MQRQCGTVLPRFGVRQGVCRLALLLILFAARRSPGQISRSVRFRLDRLQVVTEQGEMRFDIAVLRESRWCIEWNQLGETNLPC